jgi:hypothetical protein
MSGWHYQSAAIRMPHPRGGSRICAEGTRMIDPAHPGSRGVDADFREATKPFAQAATKAIGDRYLSRLANNPQSALMTFDVAFQRRRGPTQLSHHSRSKRGVSRG